MFSRAGYFRNASGEFLPIWRKRPIRLEDEMIRIWCSEVNVAMTSQNGFLLKVQEFNYDHEKTVHVNVQWGKMMNWWQCVSVRSKVTGTCSAKHHPYITPPTRQLHGSLQLNFPCNLKMPLINIFCPLVFPGSSGPGVQEGAGRDKTRPVPAIIWARQFLPRASWPLWWPPPVLPR